MMTRTRTKVASAVVVAAALLSVGALAGAEAGDPGNAGGQSSPTPKAGSSSPTESNFVPITPCRIVNTQNPAGKLAVGETRSYRMSGTTQDQGGAVACGIPSVATALEVSITAVKAEGNGYLRVWPAGQQEPGATFLNYTDVFNATNAGTIRVQGGLGFNFSVKAYQQRTHVIVDVLGYYVPELMAVVSSSGNIVRANGGAQATRTGAGEYRVNFNRNVSGCAYTGGLNDGGTGNGNEGDIAIATNGGNANGVFVQTFNDAGTLADSEFHVVVTC